MFKLRPSEHEAILGLRVLQTGAPVPEQTTHAYALDCGKFWRSHAAALHGGQAALLAHAGEALAKRRAAGLP